jgi:hypothetical protein
MNSITSVDATVKANSDQPGSQSSADNATAFLRALWADPPDAWFLLWLKDGKHSLWFRTSDLAAAAAAAALHANRTDVYLGCALSPADNGPGKRCKAEDVSAIPGLWGDVDIRNAVHKKENLPPDVDSALSLLRAMPLPPSLIVRSGYGLQAWWLFLEPWLLQSDDERQQAADLAVRWQAHLQRLAAERGWEIDSTADLARVLRLPGTLNHKLDQPVAVTVDIPAMIRRYDPADLRDALPEEGTGKSKNNLCGKAVNGAPPIGEVIKEGDRNNTLTSLGGSLRQRGLNEDVIRSALLLVNAEVCQPALPEEEVRGIARSMAGYEPGSSADAPKRPLAAHIIRNFFVAEFEPSFRRGDAIWSAKRGRLMKRSEILGGASTKLIDLLTGAFEATRNDEGKVLRKCLPKLFRDWAPTAYADVLETMPDEPDGDEIVYSAAAEFRRKMASVMWEPITLAIVEEKKGEIQVRDSLFGWCRLWANTSFWSPIQHYLCWTCKRQKGQPPRIALRAGLLTQLHRHDLGDLSQKAFSQLCEKYGVGFVPPGKACGQRVVELAEDFIAELGVAPVIYPEEKKSAIQARAERDSDSTMDDDPLAHARARENHRPCVHLGGNTYGIRLYRGRWRGHWPSPSSMRPLLSFA